MKTISLYSYKDGVGKTILGTSIATLLAKRGYKVLLFEVDVIKPELQKYEPGLAGTLALAFPSLEVEKIELFLSIIGQARSWYIDVRHLGPW